jgi:hypothetical protein
MAEGEVASLWFVHYRMALMMVLLSSGALRGRLLPLHDFRQVAVHRRAIEWDNDHLAAMLIVALVLFLGDVDDGESEVSDVAVLQQSTRPLDFLPVIDRAVGVADEIRRRIVRQPTESGR